MPRSQIVVAEGPGALPWLVAPLVRTPQQAIFLVPTARMRDAVELRRGPGFLARTSDPELAAVDTTRGVEASLARLEEHFGPHLTRTAGR